MALTACCYKPYRWKKTRLPKAAGFTKPVVTPPGDHRPNAVREVIPDTQELGIGRITDRTLIPKLVFELL
jgi:ribosomal protein S11